MLRRTGGKDRCRTGAANFAMDKIGNTFFFDWEVSLIVWLQAHIGSFGTALASFISAFGEELICIVVLGFLYWCYDKRFGRFVGINALAGLVLNSMIKNVFIRRRPYFDTAEIKCLKPVDKNADIYNITAQEFSFPSGHSTNSITVYGSLAKYKKTKALTVIGTVLPLLIGVSRFCLGVHYPTDVLAGWLLGLIVIFAMPWLQSKIRNQRIFKILILIAALPGFFYCRSTDYYTGFGLLLGFILADELEQKYVKFENTRSPLRCVLRVAGGIAIFFILNTLLKLPFTAEFMNSATTAAFLTRALRYMILIFVLIGVYPMIFRFTGKWFKNPNK